MSNAVPEFQDAMRAAGLTPPEAIEPGKLHRFPGVDKKGGNTSAWCKLFPDCRGGVFGDWSTGLNSDWHGNGVESVAEHEDFKRHVAEARLERLEDEVRRHKEAAAKALETWKAAKTAPANHPYLARKGVKSCGLRVHDGALVVPMRDGGELQSLQFIEPDGTKRFLTGGRVTGCYYAIGTPHGVVCLAEGFATSATIHEATGYAVAVAFNAGNLLAVAKAVRAKFPDLRLILCADDDHRTQGNPGLTAATEAALAVGGLLAIPDFGDDRPEGATDFNDLAAHRGLEAVATVLSQALIHSWVTNSIPDINNGATVDLGGAEPPKETTAEIVKRLAALPPMEYDRAREAEAKTLGIRIVTLDSEVRKVRGEEDTAQGQAFAIESPEPWPEPVNGVELLEDIAAPYQRYVMLPKHADITLALWTVHTHGYDYGRCTPIMAVTSPQKRCGKTTLMTVLLSMVNKPLAASNISPSCIFRSIDRWRPTLLIDEADSFLKENDELRGIINSGHVRGLAYVIRAVGDDHEPRQFSTWCPKAIALIGKLPQTLHDRAIEIPLVRKVASEPVERLRELDGEDIRRKCARWVLDHAAELHEADPTLPKELHDRAADNWRPLVAIADLVGGDWPQLVRQAAVAMSESDDDTESYAVMLLGDIRALFEDRKTDKLFSEDLVEHLHILEDQPWPQWGRAQKPITKTQAARLLKNFKIKPTNMRNGSAVVKGYLFESFADAFSRYLKNAIQTATPLHPTQNAGSQGFQTATPGNNVADQTATSATPGNNVADQTATPGNNVADQNASKPAPHNDCIGVADQKGDLSQIGTWSIQI